MARKIKPKNKTGIITLIIGIFALISSLLMYNYLPIDDVFLVILITFSIMILIYGVFQILRDNLQIM